MAASDLAEWKLHTVRTVYEILKMPKEVLEQDPGALIRQHELVCAADVARQWDLLQAGFFGTAGDKMYLTTDLSDEENQICDVVLLSQLDYNEIRNRFGEPATEQGISWKKRLEAAGHAENPLSSQVLDRLTGIHSQVQNERDEEDGASALDTIGKHKENPV